MRRTLLCVTASVGLSLIMAGVASGSRARVWKLQGPEAIMKGADFEHALVTSRGVLRLSLDVEKLAPVPAAFIWDLQTDRDGNLLAATGHEGKVFRITGGKVDVLTDTKELQVTCLAVSPDPADKAVYAGTAPGGKVLKIAPGGKSVVLFDSPESYVWDLAVAADGTVFAGTGPNGRLYRISPDGKAKVILDGKQNHILSVALGKDGQVYAGTDRDGVIFSVAADGKVAVVYDAPQAEIKVLLLDADGTLYAGTGDPKGSSSSSRSTPSPRLPESVTRPGSRPGVSTRGTPTAATPSRPSSSGSGTATGPSKAPTIRPGANSVYRISPEGLVQRVFHESGAMILALRKEGDRLLVATGPQGELFEIGPDEEVSVLARVGKPQVMAMAKVGNSVVFGTGGGGAALYKVSDSFAVKGAYTSPVLDSRQRSRWGRLSWMGQLPDGVKLTVATRTGNVTKPDATWSAWTAEKPAKQEHQPASPQARFFQFRITMTSSAPKATPRIESMRLFYAQQNLAPQFASLTITPPKASGNSGSKSSSKTFSGTTLKWKATDPNGDKLAYRVYFRKVGWQNWLKSGEEGSTPTFKWDTRTLPLGMYQVKVVASDKANNAPGEALEAERISFPFPVDHVAPTVTVKATVGADGTVSVTAKAVDQLATIAAAQYCTDSGKWQDLFPVDGMYDGTTEQFEFKTKKLTRGHHVIMLRVGDAHRNITAADASVEIPK